jgi:hypothetical protein
MRHRILIAKRNRAGCKAEAARSCDGDAWARRQCEHELSDRRGICGVGV